MLQSITDPFLRRMIFVGVGFVGFAVRGAAAEPSDVAAILPFSKEFRGVIADPGDVDVVGLDDIAGSKLSLIVEADLSGAGGLALELLDSDSNILASGVPNASGSRVTLSSFVLPATGRYFARISASALSVAYSFTTSSKAKKKLPIPDGSIQAAGEIDAFTFSARAGSSLSGTIARKGSALQPKVIELIAPSGTLIPVSPGKGKQGSKSVVALDDIALPEFGEYRIRVTGQGGTTGAYHADLRVTPPKKQKGVVYEQGHPELADDDAFTLEEVFVARGVRYSSGAPIEAVSPFTYVDTDPLSGLAVPGTLAPLFPGAPVGFSGAIAFGLDEFLAPLIVPRDAVLVMRFTRSVSSASLALDSNGLLTAGSPLQVRVGNEIPPLRATVDGKDVILEPTVSDTVGFPASPFAVNAAGVGVASSEGVGAIEILAGALAATNGATYEPRDDLMGSSDSGGGPIPFNPGNAKLDAFVSQAGSGNGSGFGGFLPSRNAPRIVREVKLTGEFTPSLVNPALGDAQSATTFAIVLDQALDLTHHQGKGEYAGGALRIRPGESNVEIHRIVKHTVVPLTNGKFRNEFFLATSIASPLKANYENGNVADGYEIARLEYFEPDPEHPIDPATFDPDDPDLAMNTAFENFIEIRDRNGALESDAVDVDPLATFTVRFSEPMAAESFRPYESFAIERFPASANPGLVVLGVARGSEGGRAWTFVPGRDVQFGAREGTFESIPMAANPALLRFVLRSVPSIPQLQSLLGQDGAEQFVSMGVRGITDVRGRSLAFGPSQLDSSYPVLEYGREFSTRAEASAVPHGAVVHRFQGQPMIGAAPGITGVNFKDMPTSICSPLGNLYGPKSVEVNLFANGFLSGAAVTFVQKIHDDFHPPPTGTMSQFPFATTVPLGGFGVLGGSRYQDCYRAVDASPDYEALHGTKLALTGVSYSPLLGALANTILPDVSIHAGHSAQVPDTMQIQGIPSHALSGLSGANSQFVMGGHFTPLGNPAAPFVAGSYNATTLSTGEPARRHLVHGAEMPGTVSDSYEGRQIVLEDSAVYQPPASPQRKYVRVPAGGFDRPFSYDNGDLDVLLYPSQSSFGVPFKPRNHSLVLEYRIRVKDPLLPPATTNAFSFAIGILSSALPRFRIFTIGVGTSACCVPVGCSFNCAVVEGPPLNGLPGGGGQPLDPDFIVNAVGPRVMAPGLPCFVHSTAQNAIPCPPTFTNQSSVNPDITAVALGLATPSNANNFGDNERYFIVFDYVKVESRIVSPFVRAQPTSVTNPNWLEPIFDPPLSAIPLGTSLSVRFRASTNGLGASDATPFVDPGDVPTLGGNGRPFIQFEAEFRGDTSTQLVPILEELVIPFRIMN